MSLNTDLACLLQSWFLLIAMNSNWFYFAQTVNDDAWSQTNWKFKAALSIYATVLNKSSNKSFNNHKSQNFLLEEKVRVCLQFWEM